MFTIKAQLANRLDLLANTNESSLSLLHGMFRFTKQAELKHQGARLTCRLASC